MMRARHQEAPRTAAAALPTMAEADSNPKPRWRWALVSTVVLVLVLTSSSSSSILSFAGGTRLSTWNQAILLLTAGMVGVGYSAWLRRPNLLGAVSSRWLPMLLLSMLAMIAAALPVQLSWVLVPSLRPPCALTVVDQASEYVFAFVATPLAEEVGFRMLLYDVSRHLRWSPRTYIGLSGISFMVWHTHYEYAYDYAIAAGIGLALAWVYQRSRSLLICVLAHSAYNLYAWLLSDRILVQVYDIPWCNAN
jgi:membrane protease YdiL (CAAX protease family)